VDSLGTSTAKVTEEDCFDRVIAPRSLWTDNPLIFPDPIVSGSPVRLGISSNPTISSSLSAKNFIKRLRSPVNDHEGQRAMAAVINVVVATMIRRLCASDSLFLRIALLVEAQETRRIVVKNVAFLLSGKKICRRIRALRSRSQCNPLRRKRLSVRRSRPGRQEFESLRARHLFHFSFLPCFLFATAVWGPLLMPEHRYTTTYSLTAFDVETGRQVFQWPNIYSEDD
jgi:hypothetical protein